jgi:hypothetical protein
MAQAGKLNDSSYLFTDLGVGYWLAPHGEYARPTALVAELHHSTSLSDSDEVRSGAFQVGQAGNRMDILNGVLGISTNVNQATSVGIAYIAPLSDTDGNFGNGLQARLEYRP